MKPKILVVDDEEILLEELRCALEADYEVLTSSRESEALAVFSRATPSVVILDLSLNSFDPAELAGLRLLEQILRKEPLTRVIIVTGNNDQANALKAVRAGAFDYYSKPVRLEELRVLIQRALRIHELQNKLQQPQIELTNIFHNIVGNSKYMRGVFQFIERVAASDISVLVSGESGTGKEAVARAIHQESQRKNNPFVVVNCGAMPEILLERELFGHEKVTFAGAHDQKPGKFELADSGTIFLDEIGELAPALQVKLLRFLEDRKIERVGGTRPIEPDIRIIAATKRDLEKDIRNHMFREDLYYRLKVMPVKLLPLRERKDDIIPLAQYFLQKFSRMYRKPPLTLSAAAEDSLLTHSWEGNVRELENLISRAVVLSFHTVLRPSDLGLAMDPIPTDVNLKAAKKAIEMDFVKKALVRNRGVVSRAARDLGISRVNLYELMQKYNIRIHEFKPHRLSRDHQMNHREVI